MKSPQAVPHPAAEPIAVIGLAGRFPGARNLAEFWENLRNGVESIATLTDEQLEAAGVPRELRDDPAYVKRRPLLVDVPLFDASFFGFAPQEASRMDPQQRIFLETAWEALEHAGYDSERHPGSIGVFAGCHFPGYLLDNLCSNRELVGELLGTRAVSALPTQLGNEKDSLTTRVAYKLNLRGPAITVQTACSTSLVAVVLACDALRAGQADVALAGGVAVLLPEHKGHLYQEGAMVSADGHCRTFDAQAQGTIFGSGAGVVVLKKLSRALADRDTIHAVIKGAALNNDGALKASYTAPAVNGQAAVIRAAQVQAGVAPETISYIEAHGTATPLGDPVEIAALTQAFRRGTEKKQFCALGSVKTNIGHLDAAAGIAGLIKTVLMLRERIIPPTLHFTAPNPRIDFAASPFKVATQLSPWTSPDGHPRRAGVSAFGVGGTNAHVVLEEAPAPEPKVAGRAAQLLIVSARTPTALDAASQRLAEHLRRIDYRELDDVAYTLQVGRREFPHRRIVVCRDSAEAIAALEKPDARRAITQLCEGRDTPVVFLFPGQASQYAGMGAGLYRDEPVFREAVGVCAGLMREHLDLDVVKVLCPSENEMKWAEEKLSHTRYAQPALFVMEYALARLWMSWGIQPAAMAGHSLGEYVAATIAGVFTLGRAIEIVCERAKLVDARPRGAMLAVRLAEAELRPLLGADLDLAAVNSAELCVASGPLPAIERLEGQLRARNAAAIRLAASHAFHSAMLDPIVAPLAKKLRKRPLVAPSIPLISSITGRPLSAQEATDPEYWAKHARRTVRFADALGELLSEPRILLEVGPGSTLTTLARQHAARTKEHHVIASIPSPREPEQNAVLRALGCLWLGGVRPDWGKFHAIAPRRRVPLPTYPFERKRFWIDPVRPTASSASPDPLGLMSNKLSGDVPAAEVKTVVEIVEPTPVASVPVLPLPVTTNVPVRTVEAHTVSAPPMNSSGRRERLAAELQALFRELSGVEFSAADCDRPFAELGLDSLFLTQVRQAFQARYNVRVTFRQLQDEAGTLSRLAELIDRSLPAEASPPAAPATLAAPVERSSAATPAETPASSPTLAPSSSPAPAPAASPVLEDLLRQQLELMRLFTQQQQANVTPPPLPLPAKTTAAKPSAKAIAAPAAAPSVPEQALTPAQRQHLAELVERVTARTPGSKRAAQAWHRLIADPRATVNFRQAWKELVYQLVVERSAGARVWDIDGNDYLDVTMGFGVHLLGHSPSYVVEAIGAQLTRGLHLGPQYPLAGEVAALLREFTGMDRFAFSNSGSEAIATAVRVARAATGRDTIVYFNGSYHGVFDEVLWRAPAGGAPRPIATGIPGSVGGNVVVLDYAAPASLERLREIAPTVAAILVEPVQNRHPDVKPAAFLRELRAIASDAGALVVFDEAITGFRLHPGGAQALLGVRADLAIYGKVLGGGLPFAVLAGRDGLLDAIDGGAWQFGDDSAPEADVTFATATFLRNPLALAAARATLLHLKEAGPTFQEDLSARTDAMVQELNAHLAASGAGFRIVNAGSLFRCEFPPEITAAPLLGFELLARGVYFRDVLQSAFLSAAHTAADVRAFVEAFKDSVAALQRAGFLPGTPPPRVDGTSRVTPETGAEPVTAATFALTPAQREVWLACQLSPEASCAYNEAVSLHLHGVLRVEALGAALNDVVARHEALRATFSPQGDTQTILPEVRLALPVSDWSHLSEEERAAHVAAFTAQNMEEPFDLVRGPVVRVRLIKLAEQHHQLFFTAHHLVCDGETTGIVLRELGRFYSARANGAAGREAPAVQFRELAAAQARQAAPQAEAEKFWLAQFTPLPAPLPLPLSRPRETTSLHPGGHVHLELDAAMLRALKRVGAKQGGSLFNVLLAAFKAWLLRLAAAEETVVGVFTSMRTVTGREGVVGHTVTTLPLRTRAGQGTTFAELLAQVGRAVLDAREHADFTYGDLVQRLQPPREPGRAPLIDAVFNFYRNGEVGAAFHGLETKLEPIPHNFVNFDLFLDTREFADRIVLDLEYRADLFDAEVMASWFGHFRTLLEGIAEHPETKLGELPLLSASERRRILTEWNQTTMDYPRNACLHELFEAQAEATPEATAMVVNGERLSYRALNRCANRLAHHLRAQGVTRDTHVGLCLERGWRMVAAVLAVLKAGGAYVPLDPTHPLERIDYIRRDARLRALVTEQAVSERLAALTAGAPGDGAMSVVCLDRDAHAIAAEPAANPVATAQPASLAYILYTSGSTGRPKGVAIEHRNVVTFVHWAGRAFSRRELDGVLAGTTLGFDISVFELFAPLCHGGKIILVPNVLALADLPDTSEIRLINTVPSAMAELLRLGAVPATVETVNLAGEPLPTEIVDQLYALPHIKRVNDLYGPTETTIYATHAVREAGAPATIGRPLANVQAFILDRQFQPVPLGVPGELCLGGEQLARGYLGQPGLTAEKFVRHPFSPDPAARLYRTGDLCRWRADGCIEFIGRIDHQLKLRGYRIEPGEIEAALTAHPAIDEAVVIAREDTPGDRRLVAYVVPVQRAQRAAPEELLAELRGHVEGRVPPYMVPDAIVPLAEFPRTPAGKLDRKALPQPGDFAVRAVEQVAPRNSTEQALCALWRELLGVESIGVTDNFFAAGGHSLLATRVIVRARELFQVDLPTVAIFSAPTIAGLAREIESRLGERETLSNPQPRSLVATE